MTKDKPSAPTLADLAGAAAPAQMAELMTAVTRMQGKMVDAVLRQNIETLDFLKERFEKDRALIATMVEKKDPSAVMHLLTEFWQKAMEDYANETGKLTATMASATEQAIEELTEEGKALAAAAAGRK